MQTNLLGENAGFSGKGSCAHSKKLPYSIIVRPSIFGSHKFSVECLKRFGDGSGCCFESDSEDEAKKFILDALHEWFLSPVKASLRPSLNNIRFESCSESIRLSELLCKEVPGCQ